MDRLLVDWQEAVFALYLAEEKIELDAAYSGSSIGSRDQADQSRELTYVAIDTLCGGPHNVSSVAHTVMWLSSFLRRYFSISPSICTT